MTSRLNVEDIATFIENLEHVTGVNLVWEQTFGKVKTMSCTNATCIVTYAPNLYVPYIQTQSKSNNLRSNPDSINNQTLKSNIMTLLLPYTVPDIDHIGTNLFKTDHKIELDRNQSYTTHDQASLTHRRPYIVNCVGTFIYRM